MNRLQARQFVENCNEAAKVAGYGDGVVSINTAEAVHQLLSGEPAWEVAKLVIGWAAEHCHTVDCEARAEG